MIRMSNEAALDVLESTVVKPAVECLDSFLSQVCRAKHENEYGLPTVSAIMHDDSQEIILMQEQTPGNMKQVIAPDVVRWVCAEHFTNRQYEAAEDHQDEDTDEEDHKDTIDDKEQWLLDALAEVDEYDADVTETSREKAGVALGGKVKQELYEELFRKLAEGYSKKRDATYSVYNSWEVVPERIKWTAREKAIAVLGGQVEQRQTALQELIEATSDRHGSVREAAVRFLRGPSKASHAALEAVVQAVEDRQWNVQEAAVQILGDQVPLPLDLVTILFDAVGSKHLHVMRAARDVLTRHASSEPTRQHSAYILLNGTINAKMVAIEILATLSKLPESATVALIITLEDDDQDIRSSAVHILQCQSELSELAIQSLVMMAREGTLDVRQAAIRVLDSQISVSGSVIPALIECLKDEGEDVRRAAVRGLRDNYGFPPSTVRQLMEVLSHGHVQIREASAEILGEQTTLSEAMMQALIKSPNNDPIIKEASVQGPGTQVERPQSVIDGLVGIPKDRGLGAEEAVASSLLDFFKALREQDTESVTREGTEMETPETLQRERAKILQRTVVNSSKMIDFEDITNIQQLPFTGRTRIQTAEWSRLRVVLKGRPSSKEGVERFDQEVRCSLNKECSKGFTLLTLLLQTLLHRGVRLTMKGQVKMKANQVCKRFNCSWRS
jgi:HEAT repeat protein